MIKILQIFWESFCVKCENPVFKTVSFSKVFVGFQKVFAAGT